MPLSHAIARVLRACIATAAAGAAVAVGTVAAATAAPPAAPAEIRNAGGSTAIPGSYLVVLKDAKASKTRVSSTVASLTARYGGTVGHRYTTALRGFSVRASETTARRMAADPAVAYVEQDHRTQALDATQLNPPSWGLDRVDQRNRPVDNSYTYPSSSGAGVHAYVIDSGIRTTHQDIAGRAVSGIDLVDGGAADDCYGHGSHVAGTVGGTAHGVAKSVTLVAVRVFDCQGFGDMSRTVAAIDWVAANAVRPAVTNMSLGYFRTSDTADTVGTATRGLIATGVAVVVSAGNNGSNACDKTPAYVAAALTVGNTWSDDGAAGLSNEGSCVDLFAPGQGIRSLHHTSDTATGVRDGTSMSAPHVAGAAALLLGANPTWTPAQVHSAIIANATTGVVTSLDDPASPNRLLYVPPS
ncbi:S8 family peptidase [Micromonospora sp. CPCC 206061]|uniref:S8 family peptidase n=1 Tax=Micromonospora sp. CPCC 206061 TaxID=3122410 RepID=UPI002FEF01A7